MSILRYKKGSKTQLSNHFKSREFDCPCNNCNFTLINKDLVSMLEGIRTSLGSPLKITSGYRCEDYQNVLKSKGYDTAKGISQHQLGNAADITNGVTPGYELEDLAQRVGFQSIGVGKKFIHVDTRPGHRRWKYSY